MINAAESATTFTIDDPALATGAKLNVICYGYEQPNPLSSGPASLFRPRPPKIRDTARFRYP
jgi:hypothetical protein